MLFLLEKHINIGINMRASEEKRTGCLWVEKEVDGVKQNTLVPFIIDRPNAIRNGLNLPTWRRLKKQIEKMELNATHLELSFPNGKRFCYLLSEYKELYVAKGKGRPIYVNGVA